MNSSNTTKSNFGKWGWSMIIYCAISFYLAAVLSTDTLNWFPTAFTQFRGWDPSVVDLCNTMAGIGGWLGILGMLIAIPLFSVVYMLISRYVNTRLKEKGLPTDRAYYESAFSVSHYRRNETALHPQTQKNDRKEDKK